MALWIMGFRARVKLGRSLTIVAGQLQRSFLRSRDHHAFPLNGNIMQDHNVSVRKRSGDLDTSLRRW